MSRKKISLCSIWYPPPVFLVFAVVVVFGFFLYLAGVGSRSRRRRTSCGNRTRKTVDCTDWQSLDPSFDPFPLFHHPLFFGSHSCGCGGFGGYGFHICSCAFGSIVRWNHSFAFSNIVAIPLAIVIIVIIIIYYYDCLSVVQDNTMYTGLILVEFDKNSHAFCSTTNKLRRIVLIHVVENLVGFFPKKWAPVAISF